MTPSLICKVCGLTRAEDVLTCHEAGVDFIGCIFVPDSPRFIPPEQAARLPGGPARKVGVFAGQSHAQMLDTARLVGLDFLQLHGGESPELCRSLGAERVIKVIWPDSLDAAALLEECRRFADACAFFLFDAGRKSGGSGKTFNWRALAGLRFPRPWLLAGGLNARLIPKALRCCVPDGLDLNSGLENSPGVKNPQKIREAVTLAKGFYRARQPQPVSLP